jgi:hypothetical protein
MHWDQENVIKFQAVLTANGILAHQLLDCWILDFASGLIYELKPLILLTISNLAVLYVFARCFSRRGQRLPCCGCMRAPGSSLPFHWEVSS